MKKLLLNITLMLMLGSTSVYAVEINKYRTFTINSEKESLKTSFKVTSKAQSNTNEIENRFEKTIQLAKQSSICKGGEYRIYPSFKYVKSERIDDGYKGELFFQCSFKNKDRYEKLIDDVKKINDIELTQNQIQIVAKDKTFELEKLTYQYAIEYIKNLNQYFSKCEVDTITFLNQNQSKPIVYLQKTMAAESTINTTITAPIENMLTQSLKVNYKFECKKAK